MYQGVDQKKVLTQSIMVFVKRMNHMFLVPDLSSLVDSAAPTLPAGYSPPMPMPTYLSVSLSGVYMATEAVG